MPGPQTASQKPTTAAPSENPQTTRPPTDMPDPNIYNPLVGFNLCFDFASRILRQFRSMRVVYGVYNIHRAIINPSMIEEHDGEPDLEDPDKNKIWFKVQHLLKNIQAHPSTNLVIEF
jgi:hypothetical protein